MSICVCMFIYRVCQINHHKLKNHANYENSNTKSHYIKEPQILCLFLSHAELITLCLIALSAGRAEDEVWKQTIWPQTPCSAPPQTSYPLNPERGKDEKRRRVKGSDRGWLYVCVCVGVRVREREQVSQSREEKVRWRPEKTSLSPNCSFGVLAGRGFAVTRCY